jgi:tripartite-type tricarboxylate transporter receptor subunit TctC
LAFFFVDFNYLFGKVMRLSLAFIFTVLSFSSSLAAQTSYPTKPVKIVVPFLAGGTTDIIGRLVAQELSKAGINAVVENRPGAGGNIGAEQVAKSPADGYTLFVGTVGTHGINASLYAKLPYDPIKDFAPVTLVASVPNVLVVHPSIPANNVKELIALVKAKPGKYNYASSGNGTSIHLSGELFKSMTGAFITHIPYRGSSAAISDVMGGQVDMMFDNLPTALPHIKSGKLKALGLTSAKQNSAVPGVPTIGQSLPGYEASSWFGLFAPAGTPKEIVTKLNQVLVKAISTPEVRERLLTQGAEPVGNTPEQFADYVVAEIAKWAKVVKASGAKVD